MPTNYEFAVLADRNFRHIFLQLSINEERLTFRLAAPGDWSGGGAFFLFDQRMVEIVLAWRTRQRQRQPL